RLETVVVNLNAQLQQANPGQVQQLEARRDTAEANLRHATDSLNLAEGRLAQAKAEQNRAVEQARADLARAVERAAANFEAAKRAYAAVLSAAARQDEMVGVFAPLRLTDDSGVSSHPSDISKYIWWIMYDSSIVHSVMRYQEKCLADEVVANSLVPGSSRIYDRLEHTLVNRFSRDANSRLPVILTNTEDLRNVRVVKRKPNYGPDAELVAYVPFGTTPAVVMPFEVKRWFGDEPQNPRHVNRQNPNFVKNVDALTDIAGGRNILNVWYAINQTAGYIVSQPSSHNRGVIYGKDAIFLLKKTTRDVVVVSGAIPYTSTDPHPMAAIAYWVGEAVKSRFLVQEYNPPPGTNPAMGVDGGDDGDPLDKKLDLEGVRLRFVQRSRCGHVYTGVWRDGQAVVVKAAPYDDYELLDELRLELQAYGRLKDLQGGIIPRLVACGWGVTGKKRYGLLVVERIPGEMARPLDMDQRPELTGLTHEERAACEDALRKIHERGVAHGDVRGANLLFRSSVEGAAKTPVFIDFGFAVLDDGRNSGALEEGQDDDREWLQAAFEGKSKCM
ncbi:hypothetical protein IWQ57_002102, partial [Coemansia nantahalensis]